MSNDRQLIERLQRTVSSMQETNKRLEVANQEAAEHLRNCDSTVKAFAKENQAARLLIWAMAHATGGPVEVTDDYRRRAADDSNQITSRYEPEKGATVIEATVKLTGETVGEKGESDNGKQQ
jgi:hypothetical protein